MPSSFKEIPGDKAEKQDTQVSLPGDTRQKGNDEEASHHRYPEGKWCGDGEDKNSLVWSQHGKYPAQSKDSPGSANSYRKRRCQKHEKDITKYAATKINNEKFSLPNQRHQICPEEVKRQHVENDMPQVNMSEHAGHYRPWLMCETGQPYPEKIDNSREYKNNYKQQEVYDYYDPDKVQLESPVASISHRSNTGSSLMKAKLKSIMACIYNNA